MGHKARFAWGSEVSRTTVLCEALNIFAMMVVPRRRLLAFSLCVCCALGVGQGQHRKTVDGRLCASSSVHEGQAVSGCTTARNPDGVVGRAWCYVDSQVAGAGSQTWGYCGPSVAYAVLRSRLDIAFAEKAHEMSASLSVVQTLSKQVSRALEKLDKQCGGSLKEVRRAPEVARVN